MRRIGVDAHVLTGKYQGSRTWLLHILRQWAAAPNGDEVIVYSDDPAATEHLLPARVRAGSLASQSHRMMPQGSAARRLLLGWPRAMRSDSLDYLITQYHGPPYGRSRQIVVVHDVLFETHPDLFSPLMRARLQMLVRRSVRGAPLVVTVSEYSRQALRQVYGLSDERIVVARNGFTPLPDARPGDLARFRALRPYVLMVGRLEARKNVELALAATASMRRSGTRLVLVGSPDKGSAGLMDKARRAEGVVHLSGLTDQELAAAYGSAGVLAFPSEAEGFGLPVLEALASRVPVVASSATAIPEVAGPFATYFDPTGADAATQLEAGLTAALEAPVPWDQGAVDAHVAQFDWARSAQALRAAIATLP